MRPPIYNLFRVLRTFRRSLTFWGSTSDAGEVIRQFVLKFRAKPLTRTHRSSQIILAEITQIPDQHISLLTLLEAIRTRGEVRVQGFRAGHTEGDLWESLSHRFAYRIAGLRKLSRARVSRNIGFKNIVVPHAKRFLAEAERISQSFFLTEPTPNALEVFSVRGIQCGDLIYDAYLRERSKVTVCPEESEFQLYFQRAISLFLFWEDYLEKNRVDVFVGSNVYLQAIPQRIAIKMNKEVFDAQGNRIHRLTPDKPPFSEFFTLAADVGQTSFGRPLENGLGEESERSIIAGNGTFAAHLPKTVTKIQSLDDSRASSGRLVAFIPSLRDSPHTFGLQAFPDPYHWVEFLCEFSENNSLPLSVKVHPISPEDAISLAPLFRKYPRVVEIHHSVKSSEVLDASPAMVLSIRGHVALEAGLRGLPIALAGRNNPYVSFGFASCAANPSDYGRSILALLSQPPSAEQTINGARRALRAIEACFPDDVIIPGYHELVSQNKSLNQPSRIYLTAIESISGDRIKQNHKLVTEFVRSSNRRLSPILAN